MAVVTRGCMERQALAGVAVETAGVKPASAPTGQVPRLTGLRGLTKHIVARRGHLAARRGPALDAWALWPSWLRRAVWLFLAAWLASACADASTVAVSGAPKACPAGLAEGEEPVRPCTWCWANPYPAGEDLVGAWSNGPDDTWIVGDGGNIHHWDGETWTSYETVASSEDVTLFTVWGDGKGELWIVGDPRIILHYDGEHWSQPQQPCVEGSFVDVWGTSSSDVWVTAGFEGFLHWDGSTWSRYALSGGPHMCAFKIWGSSPSDVWSVGLWGTLAHWDGTRWEARKWRDKDTDTLCGAEPGAKTREVFFSLTGTAWDDVWVGGMCGTLLHYDGTQWTRVKTAFGLAADAPTFYDLLAFPDQPLVALVGNDAGAWVVRGEGMLWKPLIRSWQYADPTTAEGGGGGIFIDAIDGSSPDDVWVLGYKGGLVRVDATTGAATRVDRTFSPDPIEGFHVTSGWAGGTDDIWVAGYLLGAGPDEGMLGQLAHFDGTSWHVEAPVQTDYFSGIRAVRDGPVWVYAWDPVYDLLERDGETWRPYAPAGIEGEDPWPKAFAKDDIWVHTSDGTLYHGDGQTWPEQFSPDECDGCYVAWRSSPDEVWGISGAHPQQSLWRFDGSTWTEYPIRPPSPGGLGGLGPMAGSGPDDVWCMTSWGLGRWDGETWTFTQSGSNFGGLAVVSPTEAYAVYGMDCLLHKWDGSKWTFSQIHQMGKVIPDDLNNLVDIEMGPENVWVFGEFGKVLRHPIRRPATEP